jgi:MFS family permease
LMQGVGNFFWIPLANKYGRRPAYVASYVIYTACAIWLCFDKTFNGFLAGRIVMGFGAGAAETIGKLDGLRLVLCRSSSLSTCG